jgi:alpha-N-dichloroacetyl-p-aminophenylserinol N-oxygenase
VETPSPQPATVRELTTLLSRLTETWPARAGVKRDEPDPLTLYVPDAPDFLEALLPFREHPRYQAASTDLRQQVLTCGWIAYNEKTVAIESHIIVPACRHVIDGEVAGAEGESCRQALAQIFVDEAFHVLLILNAARAARARRGLLDLRVPSPQVVTRMLTAEADATQAWQRPLIRVLCAIVSEVSISDYLALLATAPDIQPLNRIATDIHRKDEATHALLFKAVARALYRGLSPAQRDFVRKFLPRPLAWFADFELEVWRALLRQIGFPGGDAMIDDCKATAELDLARRDYSGLADLAAEFGFGVEASPRA